MTVNNRRCSEFQGPQSQRRSSGTLQRLSKTDREINTVHEEGSGCSFDDEENTTMDGIKMEAVLNSNANNHLLDPLRQTSMKMSRSNKLSPKPSFRENSDGPSVVDTAPKKAMARMGISEALSPRSQAQNAMMWTEVALRIDFLAFVICAFLAISIPIMLFAKTALSDSEVDGLSCRDDDSLGAVEWDTHQELNKAYNN